MRDEKPSLPTPLGGRDRVGRVAELLSAKVFGDPMLAPLFHGTDATALRAAMGRFLSLALGGAETVDPLLRETMRRLRSRGFDDARLERWIELLLLAVAELGADPDVVDQVAMNAECAREELLRDG